MRITYIILLLLAFSISLSAKPDECRFPKPKIQRLSYQDFNFQQEAWDKQNFRESEFTTINIKNQHQHITHELPVISALIFKGTYWTESEVIARIDHSAEILNQCGVRINSAHLIKAIAPNKSAILRRHQACFNPEADGQHHVTNTVPYMPGLRIFFIEKLIIGPDAFAAPEYSHKNTPAQNVVWMARPKKNKTKTASPNYQVLAHEFGHILLNSGHTWDDGIGTPNLMSGKRKLLNNVLTEKQCDLIKQHRLVRKVNNFI